MGRAVSTLIFFAGDLVGRAARLCCLSSVPLDGGGCLMSNCALSVAVMIVAAETETVSSLVMWQTCDDIKDPATAHGGVDAVMIGLA